MGKSITVKADVEVPLVPNFLNYNGGTIRIADIAESDLRKIGEAWTEALIEKARKKRENKED
jgi:hypothetical protein